MLLSCAGGTGVLGWEVNGFCGWFAWLGAHGLFAPRVRGLCAWVTFASVPLRLEFAPAVRGFWGLVFAVGFALFSLIRRCVVFGNLSRNSVQLEDPGFVALVPALWLSAPRSLLE